MIVWGGRKDSDQFLNDGALYDPIKDKWTPLAAAQTIASPRELHTAVWTDKEMVIWGGQNGESILSGGAAFNPEKNTWRAIRDNRRSVARSQHSAVWTGSSMLVFGGRSKTGAFVGNKVGVEIFFENPAESASGN
jgi:N-acetylneuraminic acid mutarotase